jgi:hypothetical protein
MAPSLLLLVACAALSVPLVWGGQTQLPAPAQETPTQNGTPELKPAPPTPIAVQKAELGDDDTWDPDWDKLIEKSLPAELLSPRREREVKSLCPQFKSLTEPDKRAFWAYFFQALAGAEAGLKPTADVRHKDPEVAVIDPVTKHIARQEGLLQLAYMDSTRYGCDFDWEKDKELPVHDPSKTILQPENNLLCGINILDNQLVAQHKPVLSKTSYWVTLRPGTMSFQHFLKQMANEPAACGAPRVRKRWTRKDGPDPEAETETANHPAASSPSATSAQHTAAPAAGTPAPESSSRPAVAAAPTAGSH